MVRAFSKINDDFKPLDMGDRPDGEVIARNSGSALQGQAAEVYVLLARITSQRRKGLSSKADEIQADEVLGRMIALAERTRRGLGV